MKRLLISVAASLTILAVIFGARALLLGPAPVPAPAVAEGASLEREPAARRLGRAIQFATISHHDPAKDEAAVMAGLRAYLAEAFPQVFGALHPEVIGGGSLLLTWTGRDTTLKPVLLLSHMDVVPISPGTEKSWLHQPFSGDIDGGYVWGRGSLDDKSGVLGILEAAQLLLAQGFQPRRTLIFAFGHDEEVGGHHGAAKMAAVLLSRGVQAELILDEGGRVGVGLIDGVAKDTAMIGIAEKGYLSVELTVEAEGGHSSRPPRHTAIGRLSRAIARLEAHPMPLAVRGALKDMLMTLAPEMDFVHRLVATNLWIFEPVLAWAMGRTDLGRASLGTTIATTIFQSGDKDNVLPARARAVVNLRLLPGDSVDGALAHLRAAIDDPEVRIAPLPGYSEASPVSDARAPAFQTVVSAARATFPGAVATPYLTIGATDSKHYQALSKNIYRFLPVPFTPDDLARFHGTNERISLADYVAAIQFYERLIRDGAA